VREEDAEFIVKLRTNPQNARFIHDTNPSVENQRIWIRQYKEREKNGKEYYFIFFDRNKPVGLYRLYNIHDLTYTGGSWICADNIPFEQAVATAVITREIAFEIIGFEYEDGFKAKWNLKKGGEYSWVNDPLSVDEIGCIHTSQGIDLNYCGVIIGKDLIYRDGKIQIDTETHPTKDKAFCRKTDRELVKKIIRNTYYVLLTRGIKGCYIYCEDKALNDYIKSLIIDEVN
jgi:DUF2075 family protein